MFQLLRIGALLVIAGCAAAERAGAAPPEFMFQARLDGQFFEGKPLAWSPERMLLLGRDGRLHDFHPQNVEAAVRTGARFIGYTVSEMKPTLQQEFGGNFEISKTSHYLVVHPRGQGSHWAERFEQLYGRFQQYFRIRGFALQEPAYPLVAVVFRHEADYFQHAEASGSPMQPGTLGHYDPISNRVFLFDVTGSDPRADWSENAATIIHEAMHQTAYNVGIHQRFTTVPRWLAEGLATMFEARGVWNGRSSDTPADRLNRSRLASFRGPSARRPSGWLAALLTSDQGFRTDPDGAYADAWALTFYLCETQPRLYGEYLAKAAARPLFSEYPAAERLADFQEIFGADLKLLESKLLRYMDEL